MASPDRASDRASDRAPERALDAVLELVVVLGDDMTRGLAADGLTPARAHVLWVLAGRTSLTQRELADLLQVSPRNVTGLVDGLVATGFVRRDAHPTDRRAVQVVLTEHGRRTVGTLAAGQRELAAVLFDGLSDPDLATFTTVLERTLDRLRSRLTAEAVP